MKTNASWLIAQYIVGKLSSVISVLPCVLLEKMSNQYVEDLPVEANERYLAKLNAVGMKAWPYQLPEGCWSNDMTTWPNLEYPDIYEYLIETPGKSLSYMYCSRLL